MSKKRVYMHVEKHWTGEPAEVWPKFFAWMEKRPNFEGEISVSQWRLDDFSVKGEKTTMSIGIETESKEVG